MLKESLGAEVHKQSRTEAGLTKPGATVLPLGLHFPGEVTKFACS